MDLEDSENKNSKESEMFLEGTKVEICSNLEGLEGSWYVAKILQSPTPSPKNRKHPKGKALVQYDTLVYDDDEKPFTENVDATLIRPLPPAQNPTKLQSFEQFDVVDAFFHDGWWKGVVTKVIDFENEEEEKKSKKYIVVFENPPYQMEFEASSLRFHLDWLGESWVQAEKQKRMQGLKFSIGMAVEVNLGEENENDDWFPAVVLEEVGFNSFLVTLRKSRNEAKNGLKKEIVDSFYILPKKATVNSFYIRPPLPNSEVKKFEPLEQVYAFYNSGWRDGFITKIVSEKRYTVLLKHAKKEKEFSYSDIRPHMHFMNGNWISCSEDTKNRANGQQLFSHTNNNPKRPKVAAQLECSRSTKASLKEKTPSKNSGKNPMRSAGVDSAPTLSYPCKKMRTENSAKPLSSQTCCVKSMLHQKPSQEVGATISTVTKCSNHHLVCNEHSSESENNLEETNQEGAPENSMVEGQIPPGSVKVSAKGYSDRHIVDEQNAKKNDSSVVIAEGSRGLAAENSYQLCDEERDQQQNRVEDKIMISVEEQGTSQNSPVKSRLVPATGVVTQESNREETGDLGESMISVEELGILTGPQVESQLVPTAGEEHKVAEEGAGDMETEDSATKVVELPLEKISPLWEMIESLQVFQSIPQKPHFHPLLSCKDLDREGSAIAQMVKFANLVEKTSKLQVDSPRDAFNSYLEALAELKMYGFDVEAVACRLNELLSIKDRRVQLEDRSKKVQMHIADCTLERTNVEEDVCASEKKICELLSKIQELEEKVQEAEERQARDMLVKKMKDSQISNLEDESSAISEAIAKADHDFKRLAAASW